ncbi:hypothetical protein PC113_g13066 [Phytophthora cactorum]|uniref:Uncharacterized protein n=1 Tax=Phytophthora cactorum TaxID=29920 RepID=A0A8T0YYG0_9STRA|nr:hypothetical protein PC113_g13066 [Phytophthora cactorum]
MFGPSDEDSDETPAQSSATARTSILGVFNASAAVHELTLMQNIEIADMDDDVEDDMDDDGEDSVDKQSADDVQDEDDAGDETANGVAYVALDSDVEDGDSTETEFYVDDGVTTEALGDSETESDEEFANMDDELYAQSQDRDADDEGTCATKSHRHPAALSQFASSSEQDEKPSHTAQSKDHSFP